MYWREVLRFVSVAVPGTVTVWNIVGHVARVDGSSMQPALNPDPAKYLDYVYLNHWAIHILNFQRGEIVSLISPKNPDHVLIKRIVGMEGDTVRTLKYRKKKVTLKAGHCWVEGDNSCSSQDSNQFGPVPIALIQGKATHIVWPPWRWQKLSRQEPSPKRVSRGMTNPLEEMMSSY